MKNNKRRKNKSKFLLVILLLGLTVGFALLTATLNINGIGKINKASWNIHWDNVEVRKGSVTATTPAYIKDEKKTIVEYSVTFEKPGDFYEFTVDAVNEGDIDGQVSIVSNDVLDANDQVISNPTNIISSVTYSDGKAILPNQLLKAGRSEKYKVRVSYDADETNLITNDTEFKFRFSVTYIQSDTNGTIRDAICNASIYDNGDLTESRYLDMCEDYIDEDVYTYDTNDDGTITLTGFKSGYTISQVKSTVRDITASKLVNDKDLEAKKVVNNVISFKDGVWAIPVTVDGKKVTKITEDAFNDKGISAELVLPPTLKETADGTEVWNSALSKTVYTGTFANNNITDVGMPYNIVKIGISTFANNKLIKAEIRDSVQELGDYAYADMTTLTSVQIGKGIDDIGSGVFTKDSITTLTVPGSVKNIQSGAFYSNPITTLNIEDGVKEIQGGAFGEISAKKIVIPDSVTTIQSGAFYGAPVEELVIGDGITQIGYGDFTFSNLKKLVIGDGMKKIGAIGNTPDLVELDLGNSVEEITDGSFYNIPATSFKLPNSLKKVSNGSFQNCKLTKLKLPDSVTTVDNGAFSGCVDIEEIDTGNGLTAINAGTIYSTPSECVTNGNTTTCTSLPNTALKKLVIGNSITTIGQGLFNNAVNLKDIIIGDNVRTITDGSFGTLTGLENIKWGNSVTTISNSAFSGSNIPHLELPDSVTTVNNGAFGSCGIKYLDTGDGLTEYTSSAFFGNPFETVIFGDSVKTISGTSLSNKSTLTSVTFGASLETINNDVFQNDNLTTVDLSNTKVSIIGNNAFKDNNISSLKLGDYVTTIGQYAFENNDIDAVSLPDTVTSIGDGAFGYNSIDGIVLSSNLTYLSGFNNNNISVVNIPSTVTTIGDHAFAGNNLTTLSIPSTVTEIKREAFGSNQIATISSWSTNITTIGKEAFRANRLTTIPNLTNVQDLGDGAFASNRVTGDNAFIYAKNDGIVDNTKLNSFAGYNTAVTLPSTVTKIAAAAFFNSWITSISNYSQVTEIGDYAFGNTNISAFTVPNGVTVINTGVFFATPNLNTIDLGNVTSIGWCAFQYSRLTNLTIPASVTTISNNALAKNSGSNPNLTTITNNTGRAFDWNGIINGTSGTAFETGTVVNDAGNVTITN